MDPQDRATNRRNSHWSSIRVNFGIFCIGSLGTYAVIMFSSASVTTGRGINPIFSAAPPSNRATIVGRMDTDSSQISMTQQQPSKVVQIDRSEYCQQVATSVLLKFNHRITDEEILFMRNPRVAGSAIQQFSRAFGYAIETGLSEEIPDANRSSSP